MITFKEFLVEDPGTPKVDGNFPLTGPDVVTFILFPTFSVWSKKDYHDDLLSFLASLDDEYYDMRDDNPKVSLQKIFDSANRQYRGRVQLTGSIDDLFATARKTRNSSGRNIGIVTGRLWIKKKVVSVYMKSYAEFKPDEFTVFEKFLAKFTDPKQLNYDDAKKPKYSNKLDRELPEFRSYEEARDLAAGKKYVGTKDRFADTVHVQNPELKALLKSVSKDTPYSKLHAIADKMGITVAELQSKLTQSESTK